MTSIASLPLLLTSWPRQARPADRTPQAIDPLFGLPYSPDEVRFEEACPDLTEACPEITSKAWDRRFWIFAAARGHPSGTADEAGLFVIAGGFFIAKSTEVFIPDEAVSFNGQKWLADPKGVLLHRKGQACELIGPPLEEFQAGPGPDVTQDILQALANDAIQRYAKAFGSAEKLRHILRDSPRYQEQLLGRYPRDLLFRTVRQSLVTVNTSLALAPRAIEPP
jgi:hypothetical protein